MKSENNNLEKNISRLVKLTGDSNQPGKTFTDSLINDAVSRLRETSADQKRVQKDKTMKINWKKTLAWAASILIVCGLGFGILISNTRKPSKTETAISQPSDQPGKIAAKDVVSPTPSKIEYTEVAKQIQPDQPGKLAAKDVKSPTPSKIEYTEVAKEIQPVAKSEEDKSPAPVRGEEMTVQLTEKTQQQTPMFLSDAAKTKSRRLALEKPRSSLDYLDESKKARRLLPRPGPAGYPMAHGGTTPPNGEDVDAMFFKNYGVNPFIDTEDDHLSTFATDVDTGSYTVVRGYLHDGHLPPEKAVRVEEFVNYFKYNYQAPQKDIFAVYTEACPWSFGQGRKNSYLLRIGLKAMQISDENRKPAILTFVIDVSGSMNRENRLGLVKKSLRMLVEKLRPQDKIGIAVYGSRGRKIMDYKGLDEKAEILAAIESLSAGGSTYAEEGIRIGYEMAENACKQGFINRVILCSDGVANVGQTGTDAILEVIKKQAEKGITLSAIGFGMGNYNDVLMEQLGDKGNGYYAYIDTITEAKRIFEDNLTGTLQVVARDVKVQVDFNPELVRSYRLIGYENRDVPDDKFRDDKYDGGEIGAGHSTTALYELKLWPGKDGTVATTYVRYKDPDTYAVSEFKSSIALKDFNKNFDQSGSDFRLATTAAEFAEILRKSYWAKGASLETVLEHGQQLSREFRENADVIELVDLISKAGQLMKTGNAGPIETEEDANITP